MKLYTIRTRYMADVELLVEVENDAEPEMPSNWNIISEHTVDYQLYDIISSKEEDE